MVKKASNSTPKMTVEMVGRQDHPLLGDPAFLAELNAHKLAAPVRVVEQVDKLPTSSHALNDLLGGGLPRGKVTIFWGDAGFGKTISAVLAAAGATQRGELVVVFDGDVGSWDEDWATELGVNNDLVIKYEVSRLTPIQTLEDVMDQICLYLEAYHAKSPVLAKLGLIIIEDLKAIPSREVMEKPIQGRGFGGGMAESIFSQKVRPLLAGSRVSLLITTEARANLNPTTSTYIPSVAAIPRSLRHLPHLIVEMMAPKSTPLSVPDPEYVTYRPKINKDKVHGSKNGRAEFVIRNEPYFGLDRVVDLYEVAKIRVFTNAKGLPYTSGTCIFEGEVLGKSKPEILQAMADNEDLFDAIAQAVTESQLAIPIWDGGGSNVENPDSTEMEEGQEGE